MVDMEPVRPVARLEEDAASLRARILDPDAVIEPDRRRWLEAQLVAVEAIAASLGSDPPAYVELLERCFDLRPRRRGDPEFVAAAEAITDLLPGPGTAAERLAAWDESLVIPADRVRPVVELLIESLYTRQ